MNSPQTNSPAPPAEQISRDVAHALEEDIGTGDLTAALIDAERQAKATVISREQTIVCGRPWFDEVFRQLDNTINVEWIVGDGETASNDQIICALSGPAAPMLSGERTALNFLQTLSATANSANEFVRAIDGTNARILDTRKTIPGLRMAQKYATLLGGACPSSTSTWPGPGRRLSACASR